MTAPGDRKGPAVIVDIANSGRVTRPTRPIPLTARPKPTTDIAGDAKKLVRYLSELEAHVDELEALTASNLFGSGVLVLGIPMVAGTGKLVDHRLNRAVKGWIQTRVIASSGGQPRICETTLPTGRESRQWLQLEADKDCTLDVFIF